MGPQIMDNSLSEQINELESKGRTAEILPFAASYVMAHPQDAEGWFTLSKYIGEKDRKLECLNRALQLRPDMVDAKIAKLKLSAPIESVEPPAPPTPVKVAESLVGPEEKLIIADESVKNIAASTPVKIATPPLPPENAEPKPKLPNALIPFKQVEKTQIVTKPVDQAPLTRPVKNERVKPAGESTSMIAQYYKGMTKLDKGFLYFTVIISIFLLLILIFLKNNFLTYFIGITALGFVSREMIGALKFTKADEKKTRSFSKGAKGEMEVGAILESLGADFKVWHDVPSKRGNIDHVVLSKRGMLFMVETKANSGRVSIKNSTLLINNQTYDKNMFQQCRNNLFDLRDMVQEQTGLSVWVSACLVFTNAFVERSKPISNIRIVNKKYLQQAINEILHSEKGNYQLWAKVDDLDELFSQENRSYEEFRRKNFEQISGWGRN
jgi:hypothetical protein